MKFFTLTFLLGFSHANESIFELFDYDFDPPYETTTDPSWDYSYEFEETYEPPRVYSNIYAYSS